MPTFLKRPEVLVALVSLWLMVFSDSAYWLMVAGIGPAAAAHSTLYYLAAGLVTFGLTSLLMLLLAVGPATRAVLAALVIASSAVAFFASNYGVLFDENMLANVIETNTHEAAELFSPKLFFALGVYGLLPALIIARYPLVKRRTRDAVLHRTIAICAAVGVIAAGMYMQGKELVSLARNHREIRYLLTPLNILSATYAYSSDRLATDPEFRHIGLDATRAAPAAATRRPLIQVLIVGETARAANFSLGGYARETNPQLAARPIVYFSQATSCGTATAESLPCMFSLQTRAEFDRESSRYEDNILDIAVRAGFRVIWLDNGNSCKNVCARVETRDLHAARAAGLCRDKACYDEILILELESILADAREDTLIVMHQMGSHGPAYYLRHPEAFSKFAPECTHADLGKCSQAEIANAYDNTILYTDHVIDRAISVLEANAQEMDTALLYVSDHGESLGEYGLYLHGVPYRLAPDVQTHVPMLAWFSPEFALRSGLNRACKSALSDSPVSHDYLFHTLLGLLEIRTSVYDRELDLFSACHTQALLAREQLGTSGVGTAGGAAAPTL